MSQRKGRKGEKIRKLQPRFTRDVGFWMSSEPRKLLRLLKKYQIQFILRRDQLYTVESIKEKENRIKM
jgi:hypothetical protein